MDHHPTTTAGPAAWAVPAVAAATALTVLLLPAAAWLAGRLPGRPLGQLLALLLPLHAGGLLTVLAVLGRQSPARSWPAALGLAWPPAEAGGGWTLFRRTALRLAWVYPLAAVLAATGATIGTLLGHPPAANPLLALVGSGSGPLFWLAVPLLLGVLVPLAEEILFRVVLHDALAAWLPAAAAAGLTALLFAALHGSLVQAPSLFLLGVVLQRLRNRAGSLWPALGLHMGVNLTALVLLPWLPA
ncbi:MAG: CPBP family glutamic-type intramembrane protease [Lentisphaeria bacterium]